MTVVEIEKNLLSLDVEERARITGLLIDSFPAPSDLSESDSLSEANARSAAYHDGSAELISHEQIREAVDERYRR